MKPKKKDIFICSFLIILIFIVYAQTLDYDFINFDDDEYVTENQNIKKGVTTDSILWALTHFYAANWHPITWISHMIDYQFFGLNAGWHHLTNLIFHLINSLLLYIIFRRMTGKLWQSGFVAALFALHPLHVESVAWISERKDVLCTFFGMLTILNYIIYVRNKKILNYAGVILFFIFGLMSKPMLVTLPFVLVLIDYWPLNRFQFNSLYRQLTPLTRLFWEKMPLFFLSLISCFITLLSQQHSGAIRNFDQIPFYQRVANSFVSYANYIYKTIYPINLSILYPYRGMPQYWEIATSVFLIVLITFFSVRAIKTHPYVLVGWLWFLGTLVPVIGFIQVGLQSMADRYTYIPLIGLFIIISWGVPEILSGWRYKKLSLVSSSLCLILMFAAMSWQQTRYWKNDETISRRALVVTSDNWGMENNLAVTLARNGDYGNSIVHLIETLRIRPDNEKAYRNLKFLLSLFDDGLSDQSMADKLKTVILQYPADPALYFLVGKMYRDENNRRSAIRYINKSIEMDKKFIQAYYELSTLYLLNNELEASLSMLEQLLVLQPDSPLPYFRISCIYQIQKKEKQASAWYHKALEKGYQPPSKKE